MKDINVHTLLEQGLSTSLDGHLFMQAMGELSSLEDLLSVVSSTTTPMCARSSRAASDKINLLLVVDGGNPA